MRFRPLVFALLVAMLYWPPIPALAAGPQSLAAGAMPAVAAGAARKATPTPTPSSPAALSDSDRLAQFPRPTQDNGWGIHWIPSLFAQPDNMVDRFLAVVDDLGIRWMKIIQQDQAKIEHAYLIHSLVKRGMMPILRVYRHDNVPYEHLSELVTQGVDQGVYYYELYNEPNITGTPGGWANDVQPDPARLADLWLPAARQVIKAGGFPSVPALAVGGNYTDTDFLRAFLRRVIAANGKDVLAKSWVGLHNYFLNHPLDYPRDPVNLQSVPLSDEEISAHKLSPEQVEAINHARAISHQPRAQGGFYVGDTIDEDSNGFHKFEAYETIIRAEVGFVMPILSTEGGAIDGTQEDPRYPPTSEGDVATWTAGAFTYMAGEAPAYYFAFTPWSLANLAGGATDTAWEPGTWLRGPSGREMPVVQAVRDLPQRERAHAVASRFKPPIRATATPAAPVQTSAAAAQQAAARTPTPTPTAATGAASHEATPTPFMMPVTLLRTATPNVAATATSAANQVWVITWRDGEAINCRSIDLVAAKPELRAWRAPLDGSQWGLEVRNMQGKRLGGMGTFGGQVGDLPEACGFAAVVPTPTVPATPSPTPPSRIWDPILDKLEIGVEPADVPEGTLYWRVASARFEDNIEAQGRHHIYIRMLDENGDDIDGTVIVSWPDGSYQVRTERKKGNDPYDVYRANFPMYGDGGGYKVRMAGNSEVLTQVRMPGKSHVNYLVVFQQTRKGSEDAARAAFSQTRTPTPAPTATPSPTAAFER